MKPSDQPSRREVLGTLATASLAAAVPAFGDDIRSGDMLYRILGRTGVKVSAIGLGGFHIGSTSEADGIKIIRASIDRGINFMDNCWDYHDGESEIRMGKALRDGYRQRVVLMTKFDGRTRESTTRQIDESLKRLQTDMIDLMQYHENIRMDDPDRFFAAKGPLEALLAAQKAGKIKYIGFTGHKDPKVHVRMIELADQHKFHFDTAQMPINILDHSFRSFRFEVVPKLVERGIALLGMKPMAFANIPKNGFATGIECLHYALSQPTSVVITGCDSMERLDQAFEAAKTFRPLGEAEVLALVNKTKEAAMSGKYEPFKSTDQFDGTTHKPEWMG